MNTKEKGKEQNISYIMITIASSYLANNCKGCPFWDIAGSCDTVPSNCSWLGLYRHYFDDNAPKICGNNPKWCENCVSKGKCASTRQKKTNNAELFKQTFGIYATELWSMSEDNFLKWLNQQIPQFAKGDET